MALPLETDPFTKTNDYGDVVGLTYRPINEIQEIDRVKSPKAGAVCTFLGQTRDNFEGKTVTELEYEAYPSMAIKTMLAIVQEARDLALAECQTKLISVSLVHRLGIVNPLESSILVSVSSPHRRESFRFTEWILEEVKKRVESMEGKLSKVNLAAMVHRITYSLSTTANFQHLLDLLAGSTCETADSPPKGVRALGIRTLIEALSGTTAKPARPR